MTWHRPGEGHLCLRLVNNCVLEFAGPGIAALPMDFRNGIDVMTTETTVSLLHLGDGTARRSGS